jgi:hypothetical protein
MENSKKWTRQSCLCLSGASQGGGVLQLEEPGSSVSIVSDYGLDDREMEVRSPARARGFFQDFSRI